MKKSFFVILATVMTLSCCNVGLYAQNKQLERAHKKEYKAKLKQYNAEGWKLYASPRTLEVELLTYYDKMDREGLIGVSGTVAHINSKATGHQACQNQACVIYANNSGKHIKGRINSDAGISGEVAEEFEHFYAAYESLVEKEIKGELREMFTVYREIGKDNSGEPIFEMESYFLVDEKAAVEARIRAFENAAKESAAAQKYAQKISDFINEGFEVEK